MIKLRKIAKRIYFDTLRSVSTLRAKRKVARYGKGLTVNYPSVFTRETYIGDDCHFNGMTVIGAGQLHVGDHFHSGSDILIITQNHNYYSPDLLPYDHADIVGDVRIGKAVWIGTRAIILPKSVIEDGAVIQAGAVVSGHVPKCSVYGGNPARLIKYRDRDRFELLAREGKYVNWHD